MTTACPQAQSVTLDGRSARDAQHFLWTSCGHLSVRPRGRGLGLFCEHPGPSVSCAKRRASWGGGEF